MKICCVCKIEKKSDEFNRHKNRKDKLQTICRECKKIYSKNYSIQYKKELNEYNKLHYQGYKEEKKIKRRIYRESNPSLVMLQTARRRSKLYNLDFNIDEKDIIIPTKCPILGITLQMNFVKRENNSISIDRIDNNKGYVKGNIQIISWRANWLKNNASLEELKAIVVHMEKK